MRSFDAMVMENARLEPIETSQLLLLVSYVFMSAFVPMVAAVVSDSPVW